MFLEILQNSKENIWHRWLTVILGGCLCDNWQPSFLPLLLFNWRTFSRRVTARCWRQSVKSQVSANQNSRNRLCHIARRTVMLGTTFFGFWSRDGFFGKDYGVIFFNSKFLIKNRRWLSALPVTLVLVTLRLLALKLFLKVSPLQSLLHR